MENLFLILCHHNYQFFKLYYLKSHNSTIRFAPRLVFSLKILNLYLFTLRYMFFLFSSKGSLFTILLCVWYNWKLFWFLNLFEKLIAQPNISSLYEGIICVFDHVIILCLHNCDDYLYAMFLCHILLLANSIISKLCRFYESFLP